MRLIGDARDQEACERRLRELISLAAATGAAVFESGCFDHQAGSDPVPSATEAAETSEERVTGIGDRPDVRRH
jgi:hypothetical protein